ncbi:MAG: heparinase II/III family protein [Rhodospirillales bacterium]|nr:heparinase II/III family protein [Rhodospirillales bacterium]
MLSSLIRKTCQLQADPVLRRWLVGRLLGRWPGRPPFTAHKPPYLDGLLPLPLEIPSCHFEEFPETRPTGTLTLDLAGETIRIEFGQETNLFNRSFADVETLLSLHRFAWVRDDMDPAWVDTLWRAWLEGFHVPSHDWPWHPYTAGERAINILAFAHQYGMPGPRDQSLSVLAAHASVISERLEYFGDHHTSNHLANNGRALFFLGLEFDLPQATEVGAKILTEEARRIFTSSGLLREDSSHYHLLYLRLFENVAKAAEAASRPEAQEFRNIAAKARDVAHFMMLPGGLPLIGDISPDIAPAALLSMLAIEPGTQSFCADGWVRFNSRPWSGLWHASPNGFSQMPGHGHQDTGSFELHYEDEAVFIDPGRGAYGEDGEAALYRSAVMHNGLMLNGQDPYPSNRPYYDDNFCRHIAGPLPEMTISSNGVTISHHGFARFSNGGEHHRSWQFDGPRMTLDDKLEGRGRANITRTLITPLAVAPEKDGVTIKGKDRSYFLDTGEARITVEPVTRWQAYGKGVSAYGIRMDTRQELPFAQRLSLEAR